jgi:prepilin-type N-terminal cleavage/methylation domain-containing protein
MKIPNLSPRAGFSLIEMLTVIVIITLLMGTAASSLSKARQLAKKAKAESELRELVSAFQQYVSLYGEAELTAGENQTVTDTLLQPLLQNTRNITFLNVNLPAGETEYKDPWGNPYEISVGKSDVNQRAIIMRSSIAFPNADHKTL